MRSLPLALLSLAACATVPHPRVAFIEDDFPTALQQARQRSVPLVVDAWASW